MIKIQKLANALNSMVVPTAPPRRGAAMYGPDTDSPLGRGAGVGWLTEKQRGRTESRYLDLSGSRRARE